MSVMYCECCDKHIDTDHDVEHFNSMGACLIAYQEKLDNMSFAELIDELALANEEGKQLIREIQGER